MWLKATQRKDLHPQKFIKHHREVGQRVEQNHQTSFQINHKIDQFIPSIEL